ncbi:muramidase (flagellum-specific) [Leptolyngbya sp. Heron Island J]|uniref:hypothetical protein n=1 Tax=Leptolyngbya sp. Heron Island J TaxID=1385935 RepID=UPI0003B9F8BB|nr:hypothetical protein [Leptolyngbya sp. Heron Island J]ESA32711.1 muramidase (flagellum-specific) [Leptolyngbya sp. Heron Island J]
MGTWIKETDKAIYLMEGGHYRQKIDKSPHQGEVEGETFFRTEVLKEWLNSDEPPGFFLVSAGTDTDEPEPLPVTPPPVSPSIRFTKVPALVKIYHPYQLAGTASDDLVGETVSLYVDNNQTAIATTKVNDSKQWVFQSIFLAVPKPQLRRLKVVAGQVTDVASLTLTPYIEKHPGAKKLALSASVGAGGANRASDVKRVRERLVDLGYDSASGSSMDALIRAIQLFQTAISGSTTIRGDGRIDVGFSTQQFLEAANAPQWMRMPGQGVGFYNVEVLDQPRDTHDYGIDWISNVIRAAGIHYELAYRKNRSEVAPIAINDVSLPNGGKTPDHAGHQSGNAGDVVLPRKGGRFGNTRWSNANYDREATEEILKALRAQPWVNKGTLYFNDPVLIKKGLCRKVSGHDDHIHFEIDVPPKID